MQDNGGLILVTSDQTVAALRAEVVLPGSLASAIQERMHGAKRAGKGAVGGALGRIAALLPSQFRSPVPSNRMMNLIGTPVHRAWHEDVVDKLKRCFKETRLLSKHSLGVIASLVLCRL